MSRTTGLARVARTVGVVVAGIGVALAVYALTGYDVGEVVSGILQGSVATPEALTQSVRWAVPLLLIALGVSVSFRAGYFNVGAQGQMYLGSIGALWAAVSLEGMPAWLAVPIVLLAGIVCGAIWSLISGVLRFVFAADEVVTSLMLNFIAILLLQWVAAGPLKSGAGSGQAAVSVPVPTDLRISGISGVSPTILVICAVVTASAFVFGRFTRTGLEIRIAGRNPVMAKWQGVDDKKLGSLVFALSGATAGLAGAVEVLGPAGMIRAAYSPQVGFMGIIVALVGGLGVFGVLAAAAFFGALRAATLFLPVVSDVPQSGVELISGLVALLITISAVPLSIAAIPAWLARRRRRMQESALIAPVPRSDGDPPRNAQDTGPMLAKTGGK
ncbi:ABC transporter permease [Microbacterium sp. Root180]|uniref:ABC transporter permease n=1 Tax=Microbacterium sp. Root180 TaxID=1736483 RepID=UPI0006FE1107|nr:ABC transporter permease [Microbacterium sp. Root180]KRB36635.1 hypothetical protein ASD93_11315 [Microbacterium sp. Root180]